MDLWLDKEGAKSKRGQVSAFTRILEKVGAQTSADVLSMLLTPGHPLRVHLPKSGFIRVPNRVNFYQLALSSDFGPTLPSRRWTLSGLDVHTWQSLAPTEF